MDAVLDRLMLQACVTVILYFKLNMFDLSKSEVPMSLYEVHLKAKSRGSVRCSDVKVPGRPEEHHEVAFHGFALTKDDSKPLELLEAPYPGCFPSTNSRPRLYDSIC